eukprot:TRINITY_DN21026_c0_g1_i4.p1 TRINITY_DN21026_c0_g1~~TRINITY_DN21026_c0_g1_i4.p1  ORF type:complete len:288 (+),score=70.52 TRINITY_DN21026_c0_g1_i4:179-1042(+)
MCIRDRTEVESLAVGGSSWEQTHMPLEQARHSFAACTTPDGALWVLGGRDGSVTLDSVERFCPREDDSGWVTQAVMSTPRWGHGCALLKGAIVVVGGSNGSKRLGSVEMLVLGRESWERICMLPAPRYGLVCGVVEETLLVCGGLEHSGALPSKTAVALSDGKWNQLPDMLRPRARACGAAVGSKLIVAGGYSENACQGTSSIEIWDQIGHCWTQSADAPRPLLKSTMIACSAAVYVIGGHHLLPEQLCLRYDPDSGEWEELPEMHLPRSGAAAVALGFPMWLPSNE